MICNGEKMFKWKWPRTGKELKLADKEIKTIIVVFCIIKKWNGNIEDIKKIQI